MRTEKLNAITNVILIILIIIFITMLHHRNQLIAERTEVYRELTHETVNLTKQREKTNDLLIEQNALLKDY